MREILFRGKRVDNGEWVHGYFGVDDNKPLIAINKENGINGYFVYPDTVGQYTGLKDKNGNKIFEGDIVLLKKDIDYQSNDTNIFKPLVVDYCLDFSEYEVLRPIDISSSDKECWKYILVPACVGDVEKVIGNIHDNPELLEGE